MIQPQSISEDLQFSTVRIRTAYPDGREGFGTAFFFRLQNGDKTLADMIITNKHVISGATGGSVLVHLADRQDLQAISDDNIQVNLTNMADMWVMHPDPEVDLCGMPAGHVLEPVSKTGREVAARLIKSEEIPNDEQLKQLRAAEDVLMIGYPQGLWDEAHNLPVIRRGLTASHPGYNFNNTPQFLVDVACFPGSSGSPIALVNDTIWRDKSGKTLFGTRKLFLGVLFAGPTRLVEGELTTQPIPVTSRGTFEFRDMLHLGFVVKASEVLVLAELIVKRIEKLTGKPIDR